MQWIVGRDAGLEIDKKNNNASRHKDGELCHHGILGQKWGIRRYQNKDGSLTQEGKERYSTIGDRIGLAAKTINDQSVSGYMMRTYSNFGKAAKDVAARDAAKAFEKQDKNATYKDYFTKEELSSMDKSYDKIARYSNEMVLAVDAEREKMLKDPEFMDAVDKELYKQFGSGCDDEELFIKERDNIVFDKMDENMSKNVDLMKQMSDLQNKMNEEYDNLQKTEEGIVHRMLQDVGDTPVWVADQKMTYSDIAKSYVDGYIAYPAAYVVKNGAEMAFYDSEMFMDLDYSMSDYNKKHGK